MSDINTVTLTGRLGADIELRYTPAGKAVGEANLAVQSNYGGNEKTGWHRLVFWGAQAEAASKHLAKGRKIAISGRLDQDEWTDKETGKKRTATRIVVASWTFADSRTGEKRAEEPRGEAGDDEIPF